MTVAIRIENLSKQYRLGQVSTRTLSHDLNRWWQTTIRGKEDPYLKIGEVNDRATRGESEYVWALRDINLEVEQGEVLGIIGKNGAGKSTLLKILSKVTAPTTGTIKTKGRIASLLEVGTGFHYEMTGRENIYMNGAILGMTKAEITRKMDEIVDFAGVERYLDTPVKRYSSGMLVRLGFAVAAHLEPEILIVDEVLAVGDAEFQKKAIGKMQDISQEGGRTVLFVSHNMASIKSLCNRSIVLKNGNTIYSGFVGDAINYYLVGQHDTTNKVTFSDEFTNDRFALHEISINPAGLNSQHTLDEYHEIEINTTLTIKDNKNDLHLTYVLKNENGEQLFAFSHVNWKNDKKLEMGYNHLTCKLPKGFLNIGSYYLSIYLIQNSMNTIFVKNDIISFHVQEGVRKIGSWLGREPGFIKPNFDWIISNCKPKNITI